TGDDLYREPGNEKQSEGTVQAGLETVIKGIFNPAWFLDYCLNFITFEDEGGDSDSIAKKAAGYHQYHAVNKAVERTIEATSETGDKRIGVVWHTQGSGKSLSMAFYAAKLIRNPAMRNPTIIVLTDRNDLDEQLFDTFAFNKDLLGQTAKQSQSRSDLRELLSVAAGGLVFTTIQKFLPEVRGDDHPMLSDRRNIVVIADEAHRSQYGLKARLDQKTGHTLYGLAKYMRDALPQASFIGYSGTPVEKGDVDTQRVFGDYIDTYDILRAVEDGATVPIFFENRLANIKLKESEIPKIDPKFEEITEAEEEESSKQQLRTKWASLEAIVGSPQRLKLVAKDLIEHFEGRQEGMAGKGLIVCMSRRICVELYKEIVAIRPEWDTEDDAEGAIKVVMTGSASDELSFKKHIRPKKARTAIAKRFKNPKDALKLVIVRDMWLTGFDCPSMHTMYIDKPMQGHNLMQAITRVNRVFGDKPGGRVVDYLGLADALKRALRTYTVDGDDDVEPQDQVKATSHAVAILKSKYEIATQLLHGFDFAAILNSPPEKRLTGIALAMDFILGLDDGKKRYVQAVAELSKAFALAMPHDDAVAVRDEIALLQAIKASLIKATGSGSGSSVDGMEATIQQLVARAVTSTEVVDIFEAAGMEKPDISILSPEFLDEVKQLPQKNLAFELLKKLLNDEIKIRMKKNVVKARSFADMLQEAINKYRNRSIASAEVIDELIEIAKEMKEAQKEGE
ncbi:MAG: type I restriction endonuclease subunit R, partial [Planctomycetota bacterium]